MQLSERFKGRCEGISTAWREQLKLRVFDLLPANTLAAAKGFEAILLTPDALKTAPADQVKHLLGSDTWSAGIICLSPLWILFNPRHGPKRYESDIMHELAHVILKHPMISFDPATGLPLREQLYEDEATYLGSCLQVPKRGLAWAIQKKMTIQQISDHFVASEELLQFRSNMVRLHLPK